MGRLDGKVALISGGARGQGATATRFFVREGAKVVFGDILDAEGKQVEAEIRAAGGEVPYVHLDVTNEDSWRAAVDTAVRLYSKLNMSRVSAMQTAFSTDRTLTLAPTPCHLPPSAPSASPAAAAHHTSRPRRPQPQRAAAKQATTGTTAEIGMPSPAILAPFVDVVEIVGGLLLLLGLLTRLATFALLVDLLVAITTTKIPLLLKEGFWKMVHEVHTDWSMLLGALFLFGVGAGAWSLDVLLTKVGTRTSRGGDLIDSTTRPTATGTTARTSTALGELTRLFLRLGFTAFGAPAAHIVMVKEEVVMRRR
jgi:uncharacterized membrane protein YphA (DoxX/SURF4 family)